MGYNTTMDDQKYTEEEINWAIEQLKEKHPERANRNQAIQFLDTFKNFMGIPIKKIEEDKKSGKLETIDEDSESDNKKLVN